MRRRISIKANDGTTKVSVDVKIKTNGDLSIREVNKMRSRIQDSFVDALVNDVVYTDYHLSNISLK